MTLSKRPSEVAVPIAPWHFGSILSALEIRKDNQMGPLCVASVGDGTEDFVLLLE